MESWQKKHIKNNLVQLIEFTRCSTIFLERLEALHMLRREEFNSLVSMKRPTKKSKKLYEILLTRVGSYDVLIQCLEETKQSGACEILEGLPREVIRHGDIVFDKNRILGTGSFGTLVYKGTYDKRDVAVKVVNTDAVGIEFVLKEIEFLKQLDAHTNIVRYFAAQRNRNRVYIAMELCLMNLEEEVALNAMKLDPELLLYKCTKGVDHLHQHNVIHGDLKPANILITDAEQVKIADFGTSIKIPDGLTSVTVSSRQYGTLDWMAPEIFRYIFERMSGDEKLLLSTSSDVFSLGCIYFYVLSNGSHPFGHPVERQYNIYHNKKKVDDAVMSHKWFQMINKMISHDCSKRPSTLEILSFIEFELSKSYSKGISASKAQVQNLESEKQPTILQETLLSPKMSITPNDTNNEAPKEELHNTTITGSFSYQTLTENHGEKTQPSTLIKLFTTLWSKLKSLNGNVKKTETLPNLDQPGGELRSYGNISFCIDYVIGTGNFGTKVYKGTCSGRKVAVKVVNIAMAEMKTVKREIELLKGLATHENIVKLFSTQTRDNFIYIAVEICFSNLENEIKRDVLNVDQIVLINQCTEGLAHLHRQNIIHRNLKPTNILLTSSKQVKISDFGIYKQIPLGLTSVNTRSGVHSMGDWTAPEALRYVSMDETNYVEFKMSISSDVFSLGCIYYFIFTKGSHPFGATVDRQYNIRHDIQQIQNEEISYAHRVYLNLIKRMISHHSELRPPISDISSKVQNSAEFADSEIICRNISYHETELIAHGVFGCKTYKGEFAGKTVAVKVVDTDIIDKGIAVSEIRVLKLLRAQKTFVQFFCAETENHFIFIALEFCQTNLSCEMNENRFNLNMTEVLKQSTEGIAHLHKCNIIHRVLTPARILLNETGRVKISDFWFAIKMPQGMTSIKVKPEMISGFDWTVPEVFEHFLDKTDDNKFITMSTSSDVYLLGCVFFYALTKGAHPFGGVACRKNNLIHDEPQLNTLEHEWKKLIASMIARDPSKRPTCDDILLSTCFLERKSNVVEKADNGCLNGRKNIFESILSACSEMELAQVVNNSEDWKLKNEFNQTVLHIAAECGNFKAIKYFVDLGADVHSKDIFGETPIHKVRFTKTNFNETIHALVACGADINAKNEYGNSILGLAAFEKWSKYELEYIVHKGGDLKARNNMGDSVLDLAIQGGDQEAIRYLMNRVF